MAILPRRKSKKGKLTAGSLRRLNLIAAGLYLLQAALLLIFSSSEKAVRPITTGYLSEDRSASGAAGQTVAAQAYHLLFDFNLVYLVAVLLFLGALFHLFIATRYRRRYESGLKNGMNKARWVYTALSLGLLMVMVGILSGVYELSALIMVFTLTEVIAWTGYWSAKQTADNKNKSWLSYVPGLKAGLVPWFVILVYVWGAYAYGSAIPGFVYFVYLSVLLLYGAIIINHYLQLKKMGHWEDYLFGEKSFIIISFVAITAFTWQVFAGTLR